MFNRRQFLGGTLCGFFAYSMRNHSDQLFAAVPQGKARRVVVLWMNGGPTQFETFDPKPGVETGGEFKAIPTAAKDIQICETLPQIAKHMDKLSVLRCLSSEEGEHLRGQYYLHTGYRFVPAFPRPALGSVVSRQMPEQKVPKYVTIGSPGFGPAYMGPEHAPFSIENANQALALLRKLERRQSRLKLMQQLGTSFDSLHGSTLLDRRQAMVDKIDALIDTSFNRALDIKREAEKVRQRYGNEPFGQACLLARRLLDQGVNFVEVQQDGWDTHQNNFRSVRRLCEQIDKPWAALTEDLSSSGMLDDTVVIWMGEFGRTPRINANQGRDHYPQVTPAVIGGGGIAGGRAVGSTNRTGTKIEGDSQRVADLFATIFTALGINPRKTFRTDFDSPTRATDNGKAIASLF